MFDRKWLAYLDFNVMNKNIPYHKKNYLSNDNLKLTE